MHLPEASVESGSRVGAMRRATVIEVDGDGTVWCACDDDEAEALACDVLIGPGGPPPPFLAEDVVLVCLPGPREGRGVVLGKVGRASPAVPQATGPPDELVIEARRLGLEPIQACSIVAVGMSPHELS